MNCKVLAPQLSFYSKTRVILANLPLLLRIHTQGGIKNKKIVQVLAINNSFFTSSRSFKIELFVQILVHCDFERGGVKSNANNLKAHIVGGHVVVLRKGIIVNFPTLYIL